MMNPIGAYEHHIIWSGKEIGEWMETIILSETPLLTLDVILFSAKSIQGMRWEENAVMHHEAIHKPTGLLL